MVHGIRAEEERTMDATSRRPRFGKREGTMTRMGVLAVAAAALAVAVPAPVFAHCDALDGPVVQDARSALEAGNVGAVLKWIDAGVEAEVRQAFAQALAVRALGRAPQALADRYFFETVVRLHREGEGEAYTGLKPAGGAVDPAVRGADEALQCECVDALRRLIATKLEHGLAARLDRVLDARKRVAESVERGREYVAAYTAFVHYAERAHAAAAGAPDHGEARETRAGHPSRGER